MWSRRAILITHILSHATPPPQALPVTILATNIHYPMSCRPITDPDTHPADPPTNKMPSGETKRITTAWPPRSHPLHNKTHAQQPGVRPARFSPANMPYPTQVYARQEDPSVLAHLSTSTVTEFFGRASCNNYIHSISALTTAFEQPESCRLHLTPYVGSTGFFSELFVENIADDECM